MSALAFAMTQGGAPSFSHRPVLLDEVLALVGQGAPGPEGVRWVVDGTLGGAGHATAILETFPNARLIGLDRDPTAVTTARARLSRFGERAQVFHGRFSSSLEVMRRCGVPEASAMLVDLGVSSHQLDTAERGFSFRFEGPLDMRMDPTAGQSVGDLLERISEERLAGAIRALGEERFARRVARRIIADQPRNTAELAACVRAVVPKSKDGIDPATRTFQALRMLVNEELEELEGWLANLPEALVVGGVALAISFHSLEDRAVKQRFRKLATWRAPADPLAPGGEPPVAEVLTKKPIVAGAPERAANPRARSAKLRALRRVL